ncbi:MAG: hypothetical protein HN548_05605 [Opitutae bacterium]|nr:hypothetical protein [Opitutae bacterium]
MAILSLIITLVAFFSDDSSVLAGLFFGAVTFGLFKLFIYLKKKVSGQGEVEKNKKYNEYTTRLRELYAPGKEKEIQDWIKQYVPSSEHKMAAKVLQVVEEEYKERKRREALEETFKKEEKERKEETFKKEEEERKALLEKYRKEEEERKALLEKYRTAYGDEIVESWQKRIIKFGMPQQMIIDIYGEPDEIKKERTEKTLSETYFYAKDGVKYENGKTSTYKIKVEFKNAIVKGYKEY